MLGGWKNCSWTKKKHLVASLWPLDAVTLQLIATTIRMANCEGYQEDIKIHQKLQGRKHLNSDSGFIGIELNQQEASSALHNLSKIEN